MFDGRMVGVAPGHAIVRAVAASTESALDVVPFEILARLALLSILIAVLAAMARSPENHFAAIALVNAIQEFVRHAEFVPAHEAASIFVVATVVH